MKIFCIRKYSELKCMKNAITADVQNDFSWKFVQCDDFVQHMKIVTANISR